MYLSCGRNVHRVEDDWGGGRRRVGLLGRRLEDGAAASRAAAVRGPDLGAPCPPSTAYHRAVEMNGYPVFAENLPRDARGFAEKTCAFLLLLLPPLLPSRGRGRRKRGRASPASDRSRIPTAFLRRIRPPGAARKLWGRRHGPARDETTVTAPGEGRELGGQSRCLGGPYSYYY